MRTTIQKDRQIEGQRKRQTDRQTVNRQRCRQIYVEEGRWMDREIDTWINK